MPTGGKKDKSRSIRMTSVVENYILSFGSEKGFNANLEIAVQCMQEKIPQFDRWEAERKKTLKALDEEIKKKRMELSEMDDLISKKSQLSNAITQIAIEALDFKDKLKFGFDKYVEQTETEEILPQKFV